jgi:hypothetical protein
MQLEASQEGLGFMELIGWVWSVRLVGHTQLCLHRKHLSLFCFGMYRWTAEVSEFEARWGPEFSLVHVVQTSSGAQPPIQWVPGLFPLG